MASLRRSLICVTPHILIAYKAASQQTYLVNYRSVLDSFSHFYSSSENSEFLNVQVSHEESKRRLLNSLLYRSKQRGFLELDLVLGKWVEDNIHSMDEKGVKALVHVLDQENPDLWKWLTDQDKPPQSVETNHVFTALRDKVIKNLLNHVSPETRATPGQPWVRGWDDYKKGRDAPISGNQ